MRKVLWDADLNNRRRSERAIHQDSSRKLDPTSLRRVHWLNSKAELRVLPSLRNWSPRQICRTVFFLGCVGTTSYLLWMAIGPPPGMPISKETTHFLGPIDEETGLLDTYTAVLRAKGWPEEPGPHEWHRLIAPAKESDHPAKYYPPEAAAPPGELDRYRSRLSVPFTEGDDREYAAVIDANEPWYRAILDSEPPMDSQAWVHLIDKAPTQSFRYRAMLAFGRGDHAKGVESLKYLSRLVLANQRWGSDFHAITRSTRITRDCRENLVYALFSVKQMPDELRNFAVEFGEPVLLPKVAARLIDEGDRYYHLNYLSAANPYTAATETSFVRGPKLNSEQAVRVNWFLHRVDWRRFAKTYHQFVDGLVEHVAIEDDQTRTKAIEDYRTRYLERFDENQPMLTSWADVVAGDVTRIPEKLIEDMCWQFQGQLSLAHRMRRQIRLAVCLADFRNEHKRFPTSLEELTPGIPMGDRDVLRHNLTKELWDYTPQADGQGFTLKQRNKRWIELCWPPMQPETL